MPAMIHVDGSFGEGGGQILRTALALAALTGQGVHISCIRAGRTPPGLAAQHLGGVRALARLCQARVTGDEIRSTELTFVPERPAQPGKHLLDVEALSGRGSAGSATLLLQAVLWPLAYAPAPSHLVLRGGTHVAWSPPYDYVEGVFLPTVARMGLHASSHLVRWGFYPAGGGEMEVRLEPVSGALRPLVLEERGAIQAVRGRGVVSNLPSHIPQRMVNRARNVLVQAGLPAHLTPLRVSGRGPGAGLFLTVQYEGALAGFAAFGARGKPSERVADEACEQLLAHHRSGLPVDPHLADQLLIPMALAQGVSCFHTPCVTRHLLTNAHVIRGFLDCTIQVEGAEGEPGRVVVEGVGWRRRG